MTVKTQTLEDLLGAYIKQEGKPALYFVINEPEPKFDIFFDIPELRDKIDEISKALLTYGSCFVFDDDEDKLNKIVDQLATPKSGVLGLMITKNGQLFTDNVGIQYG